MTDRKWNTINADGKIVVSCLVAAMAVSGIAGTHVLRATSALAAPTASHILGSAMKHLSAYASGEVLHASYRVTGQSNLAWVSIWFRPIGNQTADRSAISTYDSRGTLLERMVIDGITATIYTPQTNSIQILKETDVIPNPLDVASLSHFIQSAHATQSPTVRYAGTQTISETITDVVAISNGGSTTTVYISQSTGVVVQDVRSDGSHHILSSLMLATLEHISGDKANSLLSLNTPPTAHLLTSSDGDTNLSTERITVAQAIAYPNRPHLVLAGDPHGLTLQSMEHNSLPGQAVVQSDYVAPNAEFAITILTTDHGLATSTDYMGGFAQPDSTALNIQTIQLVIAGVPVVATYFELPVNSTTSPRWSVLECSEGRARIRLSAPQTPQMATKDAFLSVVALLVDGQQHFDVVAHLQAELDHANATR